MCIHTAGHRKLMDSTNVQYCTCARYNCTLEYCNRNSELELSCATEYLHGTRVHFAFDGEYSGERKLLLPSSTLLRTPE